MDLKQISTEVSRVKQIAEALDGQRGTDRAIKQSDLRPLASYGMKSPESSSGNLAADYEALREDVAKLYGLLAKLSNIYGTAGR